MPALTQPSSTSRSYADETDLQAITDLMNACEVVDQLDQGTSVEELRRDFADPDFDLTRHLQLWVNAQGQLVGYGRLWMLPAGDTQDGFLSFMVHPEVRSQGLEDQILAWAEDQLREQSQASGLPANLRTGVREQQSDRMAFLETHGFRIMRYFYRMARPLAIAIPTPQLPPGYRVQSLAPSQVEAWVEMFNQTFIDHWNFHPLTVEQRQYWLSDPDYEAGLDLVALAPDGTFAAFCFGYLSNQNNRRTGRHEGWIADLGTRRGFRQQGLGRAMLLTGMQQLKAKGVDTALLGVDTENPSGALRLYKSVGFHQIFTSLAYCKALSG
ncbi:GNAT family N-acetyltransferase [Phormidium sp. FACHB-592]|uniref:GNAT family N-acetyltransferase n=1 Tax=Stenomitos frigidus AS-A4 TaxID=2933935 RepID=A0ABV0KP66_9CYAN|nr:GNAT family N-acetyltransferase [Phormidium sp. FACHB-592]MBD2072868.1 GNAT family N-acetyltransferase [Phormidium sp. FACHB-592]